MNLIPPNNVPNGVQQPKKYQGIELEKHFGLEMYETFFRGLNPQLGRFNSIDPLAEAFPSQSPYSSMDNNPASKVDPDGSYSRFGAWWRNIAWSGNGTEKDKKTGEWGVHYSQTDGSTGELTIHFQTQGSKVQSKDELIKEKLADMKQFDWQVKNGIIQMKGDEYVRAMDGTSMDEPISTESRAKSLLNVLSLTSFNSAPGALKVPGVSSAKTEFDATGKTFKELQEIAKQNSKELNAFFKGEGGVAPTKEALQAYKELATRMLNGTGGAYQRVTQAAEQLHTGRIEMIDKALESFKN